MNLSSRSLKTSQDQLNELSLFVQKTAAMKKSVFHRRSFFFFKRPLLRSPIESQPNWNHSTFEREPDLKRDVQNLRYPSLSPKNCPLSLDCFRTTAPLNVKICERKRDTDKNKKVLKLRKVTYIFPKFSTNKQTNSSEIKLLLLIRYYNKALFRHVGLHRMHGSATSIIMLVLIFFPDRLDAIWVI